MNVSPIIKKALSGDEKSKTLIYENIYTTVYGTCMKYSKTEGEDYSQDCFIRIFDVLHLFNGESLKHLRGWCKRICVNLVLSDLNKKKIKYSWDSLISNIPNDDSISHTEMIYSEDEIEIAIDQLSKKQRNVFNLFVREGYTHKEIGWKLNMDEKTSKSNLYLAKNRLKVLLSNNKIK